MDRRACRGKDGWVVGVWGWEQWPVMHGDGRMDGRTDGWGGNDGGIRTLVLVLGNGSSMVPDLGACRAQGF